MQRYRPAMDWIATQRQQMLDRVVKWSNINSGTANKAGNETLAHLLSEAFAPLGGELTFQSLGAWKTLNHEGEWVEQRLGKCISILHPGTSGIRVLLAIHMDTVYPENSHQEVRREGTDKLIGPGVADAKGGIAVMLTALEALERSPVGGKLGWEVLLNCDEEVGSPLSGPLFVEAAGRNQIGLLFEPSLPDGALVDRRKGSGTFTVLIRGRSAHAGRDFASGRNAVVQAAKLAEQLNGLNESLDGITINVGSIHGGRAANVVPDRAACGVNFRTTEPTDEALVRREMEGILASIKKREGFSVEVDYRAASPPKILDDRGSWLLETVIGCGRELGMELPHRASGGACDGNRLAAAGLPNIDTLGVRGGEIHSPAEFMLIDSLTERTQLAALLLLKMAAGDVDVRGSLTMKGIG